MGGASVFTVMVQRRYRAAVVATLALLVLTVPDCSRPRSLRAPSNALTIAQITEPGSANPLFLAGINALEISALVFSYLTTYDVHGNTIPQAAAYVPTQQNGGISKDGLTYTFHLRHDVRWQDGVALTSRDVAFTYAAIMNPKNNMLTTYGYDAVAWVRTPDPYTVVVRLRYPLSSFTTNFFGGDSNYPILPEHLLAQYPDLNHVPFNSDPVGSGPYKLVEWLRGDHMTFTANRSYFLGSPAVKRITIEFIPNSATIVNELFTGEVNMYFLADVSQVARLRGIPDHRIETSLVPIPGMIIFNTTAPIVDDPVVRRAFAMAIDRRTLVRKITHGFYDPDTGMRGLFTWAYDPHVGNVPYDPARAAALLASRGWALGPLGIREKNGKPLAIEFLYTVGTIFSSTFVNAIASYERAVGISVQLKGVVPAMLSELEGPLYDGKFQAMLYYPQMGPDPDARYFLGCSQRAPHGFNFMRYCNAQVDAALERATATLDRQQRKHEYAFVQRQLLRDLPIDFIFQGVEVDVVPQNLRGYNPSMYTNPYTFVSQWRL